MSEHAQNRSRGKDLAIVAGVLLLLLLLLLILFRPAQPARAWIFGDMGGLLSKSNAVLPAETPGGAAHPASLQAQAGTPTPDGQPLIQSSQTGGTQSFNPPLITPPTPPTNPIAPDLATTSPSPGASSDAAVSRTGTTSPNPAPATTPPPVSSPTSNPPQARASAAGPSPSPGRALPSDTAALADTSSPAPPGPVAQVNTADLLLSNAPSAAQTSPNHSSPGVQKYTASQQQARADLKAPTPPVSPDQIEVPKGPPDADSSQGANQRPPDTLTTTDEDYLFAPGNSGTKVVFVLDRSLSMMGEKSRVARREVIRTLRRLGPNTSFFILLFPYLEMPAPGLLPVTEENIQSMGGWLYSVGHRIGSDPNKAMDKALEFNPETVWLLSDGKFSAGAADSIRSANKLVQARINTIGLYSRDGETVLRQIANENRGQFRFVPPPNRHATNSASF